MSDLRVGRIIRAVRMRRGIRQSDLQQLTGIHRSVQSRLERGQLEHVSLATARRLCSELEIDLAVDARWRGGAVDRLLDRGHAAIVDLVAGRLVDAGWIIEAEYTFNEYGDRGSVDLVAWHAMQRALLIVEVKTALTDLQAMLMTLSRKVRVAPGLLAAERGWDRRCLGRILVAAGTTANRTIVGQHRSLFEATFPADTRQVKAWIRDPTSDLAGLWLVSPSALASPDVAPRQRVRRRNVANRRGGGSQQTS